MNIDEGKDRYDLSHKMIWRNVVKLEDVKIAYAGYHH